VKLLRHALFAVLLLLAQTGALTHAVEHLRIQSDDTNAPASHTCAVCLSAQGLDVALASTPPDIAQLTANFTPPTGVIPGAVSTPSITPRARAPPAA
jgi:hypothetical protein